MTIGRAPGSDASCSPTRAVSRVHARISPGNGGGARARGRRLEPRHARRRRARDRRRCRCTTARRSGSATQSCAVERRRDTPRPAARSSSPGREPARARGRAAGRGRQRDPVRDAPARALGLRAQAARRRRGQQALGAQATSSATRSCALVRQRRAAVRAARRLALAGRPRSAMAEQRFGADRARRGWRGCWPTSASAASSPASPARQPAAEAPQGFLRAAVQAAREDRSTGVGALVRGALPPRRLGAVHAPGAVAIGALDRRRARRRSSTWSSGATARRSWSRKQIGLGGLVFLLGRFAVVAVHETAHGLAMASFGRRDRARRASSWS